VLRAVAKYLRQAGITFSQPYIEAASTKNPGIAVDLVQLFRARHDPDAFADAKSRTDAVNLSRDTPQAQIAQVPSADDDRIIRTVLSVLDAMLRVSFFQSNPDGSDRPYL